MNNNSEDPPNHFYNAKNPPEGLRHTSQIVGNLQKDMNPSVEMDMAEDIQEAIEDSGHSEALLNHILDDPLVYKQEAFDQDLRFLGAQFHLERSRASSSTSGALSGSSNTTAIANFPDSSEHIGQNTQGRNFGPTGRPWRHDPDQGFDVHNGLRPSIIVHNPTGLITTPVADGLSALRLGEKSTKSMKSPELIERLCEAVHNLNKEWMQKLTSLPDLHWHCSKLSTWELFNVGIRTLQGVYNGQLPNSFTETFGLMHVAFAFSRVINEDHDSCYWDGYYSDIYLWYHSLSNAEDRLLFERVWGRLWCPRPTAQAINSTDVLLYTPTFTRDALVNTLKEGMIIKGCSDFLNALEFATIAERDAAWSAYPPSHKPWAPLLESLVGSVTVPLQQSPAIAPFAKHVLNTQRRLQGGLICTAHELELTLISREDWSFVDSQAHRRFVERVALQCDEAMGNPFWRNGFYIAHLSLALGLAIKMRQQSPSGAFSEPLYSSQPFTNSVQAPLPVLPYFSRFAPHNETEPSFPWDPSAATFHGPDTTIPTTSPCTSPASIPTNVSTYATTIPEFMIVDSHPPSESSSPASSDLIDETLACDFCPSKIFRGKCRKRSLRRHMDAEHSDLPRISCPEGCGKTFVHGRGDNVKRHVENFH